MRWRGCSRSVAILLLALAFSPASSIKVQAEAKARCLYGGLSGRVEIVNPDERAATCEVYCAWTNTANTRTSCATKASVPSGETKDVCRVESTEGDLTGVSAVVFDCTTMPEPTVEGGKLQ